MTLCIHIAAPHDFLAGGIMGVALLATYIWPGLPPLLLYGLLCAPIYLIGWFFVGRKFLLYTIYGTALLTLLGFFINFQIPIENQIYAAVAGGVLHGAGCDVGNPREFRGH